MNRLPSARLRDIAQHARGSMPGAAAMAVAVTAGVAFIASRASATTLPVRTGPLDPWQVLLVAGVACAATALVALLATYAVHGALHGRRPASPAFAHTLLRAAPLATVVVVAAALLALARADIGPPVVATGPERAPTLGERLRTPWGFSPDRRTPPVVEGQGTATDEPVSRGDRSGYSLPLALAAALLAAGFAVAALRRWREARAAQRARGAAVPASEHAAAAGAVQRTIDSMLEDADPRTAVIGAYARLLEELAAARLGRLEHEAPMEHLRRVLRHLSVRPDPLRRLTQLFERARFSAHTMEVWHREQALDALREVATELSHAATKAESARSTSPAAVRVGVP